MARLLTQRAAAAYLGMSVKRFRQICRSGQGPRLFNPDDCRTRLLYAVTVLDEWVYERDDPYRKERAS